MAPAAVARAAAPSWLEVASGVAAALELMEPVDVVIELLSVWLLSEEEEVEEAGSR